MIMIYRVWDKQNKEWIEEPLMDKNGKIYVIDSSENAYEYEDYEVEVNFSTGLYDVNGNEIFENDIVKMLKGEYKNEIMIVKKYEPELCYYFVFPDDKDLTKRKLRVTKNKKVLKLGNIYENLELLNL